MENRQIMQVEGVHGYADEKGTVWLNVEDVARNLGFVQVHKERVTTDGYSYSAVRWERVNGYLAEFDCPPVKSGDFIPENIFYRLAMKASNAAAKKFQVKVADEILPTIRKHGLYMTPAAAEKILYNPDFIIGLAQQVKQAQAERDAALAQVAEMKPKADYTEAVLISDEKLTSELIAKEYGHNAQWLHETIKSLGKMYNRGKHWYMKAPFDKEGYRVSETVILARGKTVTNHYWTQKGRQFIYYTLKEQGVLPLRELEMQQVTLF